MNGKGLGRGRDGSGGHASSSGRHHPYKREQERPTGWENEKTENKLYVGNLDHRVTEYHLIKMFSPYGKIRHEEYLWHTHGPRRGEPRGYGFVEYSTKEEADLAKQKMNGRLAFGRPLVVRFVDEKVTAHNLDAPTRQTETLSATSSASAGGSAVGPSKSAKIAAIQNKLRMMEKEGKNVDAPAARNGGGVSHTPGLEQSLRAGGGGRGGDIGGRGAGGGTRGKSLAGKNEDKGQLDGSSLPASSVAQPRTLLQTGQRWSAWG